MTGGDPRVLVTGSSGLLGSAVVEELRGRSIDVVPYDVSGGDDILDVDRLTDAAQGCSVVAHLAAVPTDKPGTERMIGTTNVLGVWDVVLAAEAANVRRIVFSSSVNAIGVFMGQGPPLRFPIDDEHPARPVTPYSVAKLAAEEILAGASRRSRVKTLCLRFPALMHARRYGELMSSWRKGLAYEVQPYWEYGAYLDVRDAARAVAEACCRPDAPEHARILLADDRPAHVAPLRELIDLAVPSRLRDEAKQSVETLGVLVDTRRGWELLGAQPEHHWNEATSGLRQ